MRNFKIYSVRHQILVFGAVFYTLFSCGNKKDIKGCKYEPVSIYVPLNLDDISYSNLRFDNGYIYYKAGVQGLIVYRVSSTEYRVFERASPIDPHKDHARVYVEPSGISMRDSVHNQVWDMTGLPYIGPSNCQLQRYAATLDGSYLYISNY